MFDLELIEYLNYIKFINVLIHPMNYSPLNCLNTLLIIYY